MDQKCDICNVVKTALSLVFTVVMIGAMLGAYATLGSLDPQVFGTEASSLAILAVVVTLMLWTTNLDCSGCPPPSFQQWVIFTVLILATIASVLGLYQAHFGAGSYLGTVGSRESSLAILAFAVTATYWAKHVQTICETCTPRKLKR
jgi:hypothetical protein